MKNKKAAANGVFVVFQIIRTDVSSKKFLLLGSWMWREKSPADWRSQKPEFLVQKLFGIKPAASALFGWAAALKYKSTSTL